jgi:hypothetical protein
MRGKKREEICKTNKVNAIWGGYTTDISNDKNKDILVVPKTPYTKQTPV